jgi:hypothetical protein
MNSNLDVVLRSSSAFSRGLGTRRRGAFGTNSFVDDSTDAERFLEGHIRRTRIELGRHPSVFSET